MGQLYKKRYGIGIYEKIRKDGDIDDLVYLFESAHDFARFLGKSIKKTYWTLGNCMRNKQKDIVIKGKSYEVAFIDLVE